MTKPIAIIVSFFVAVATACSVADGDDMGDLSNALRAMPPPQLRVVRDHRSNARIRAWADEFPGAFIGIIACKERLDDDYVDRPGRTVPVTRRVIFEISKTLVDRSLKDILDNIGQWLRPWAEQRLFESGHFDEPCELEFTFNPGAYEEALAWENGEHDAYIDDAEDSAYWLPTLDTDDLKQRPLLLGALGLAVAGGVIVISVTNPVLMALCPKSGAIECPGNPLHPGESSPITPNGAPGGDR